MVLLIVCIILSAIALLALGAFLIFGLLGSKGKEAIGRAFLLPLAGLPMLVLLFGTFTHVRANEVGIIYDDRYGVLDETLGEGFHQKSIFQHVTTISTTNRDKFILTASQTDDGQYAEFEISITYAIEGNDASRFFKKVGGSDMIDDQLMGLIEKDLQATTISYNIFDLLSEGLETARMRFEQRLSESLYQEYGITLRYAVFKDVDAGDEVESILKAKATAEQQIAIAMKEAEAKKITAENDAEIQRILADAEAYAIKIAGDAQGDAASAYVNHVLGMIDNLCETTGLNYTDSSQIVLSIIFYNTWNGILPSVLTSDSLSALIGSLINN